MAEPSFDDRGVLRGRCAASGCDGYRRGEDKKCSSCGRPPGQHQNLSKKDLSMMHHCDGCNVPIAEDGFSFCSPECRDTFGLSIYDKEMEHDIEDLKYKLRSKAVDFKACKRSDCNNPVFYSDNGVDFDFCSPKCRDEKCLREYNRMLVADISRFEKELSELCQSQQASQDTYFAHDSPVDPPQKPRQPTGTHQQLEVERHGSCKSVYSARRRKNEVEMVAFANSPNETSTSQSPKKKKKEEERKVKFQKRYPDHGIIVFNKIWDYLDENSGINTGYLITGTKVDKNLEFFKKMQSGECQLLDIIVSINGESISSNNNKPPQETLDKILSGQNSIELGMFRPPYAVQTTGKIISIVLEKDPSHIVVLPNSQLNCLLTLSNDPGIKIQDDCTILLTDEEADAVSFAAHCGLRNMDKFVASVIDSNDPGLIIKKFCFVNNVPSQQEIVDDFQSSSLIFSILRVNK